MGTEKARREQKDTNRAYLKMREEYRTQLADMVIEIKDDAYVDKPSGLLNGPKLNAQGLTVYIPIWENKPEPGEPFTDKVQLQIDRGTGTFVNVGPRKEFSIPAGQTDFPEIFPYAMTIVVNDLPTETTCRLRYVFQSWLNTPPIDSQITTVICDRLPPYKNQPPKEPVFAGDFLDDTSLPAGGKLTVTIPGYPDWTATDQIGVYLVDAENIPEDPTATLPIFAGPAPAPGVTDSTIEIDADKIRAFGDAKAVLTYALRDAALNPSPPALYKKIGLTFGPLPAPLGKPRVPQAIPGPLDMSHVREGVSVWVERHDNHKGGDAVRVQWGAQTLADFVTGNNPLPTLEIPVFPPTLMLEEYGKTTKGNKSTVVSYQIVRQGRLFGPESDSFNVNFETVLPWPDHPWPPADWPDPVHPDLLAGEVQNHDGTRTNELTRADKNEDATFHFDWYAAAANGHIVDFYWNETRVAEAQVIFDDAEADHVPGGPFDVVIPWRYIKEAGNGDPIPVHYQVTGPGLINDLFSATTNVDVNAISVELPPASVPSFAGSPLPGYPTCDELEADGSLKVAIPDLTGLVDDGDVITVIFTPMRGRVLNDPDDPITAAIFTKAFTIGDADSPITGFEFPVQPYIDHILPLYTETAATSRIGRIKIQYTFDDGSEVIVSEEFRSRTSFFEPNSSCTIPRPPKP